MLEILSRLLLQELSSRPGQDAGRRAYRFRPISPSSWLNSFSVWCATPVKLFGPANGPRRPEPQGFIRAPVRKRVILSLQMPPHSLEPFYAPKRFFGGLRPSGGLFPLECHTEQAERDLLVIEIDVGVGRRVSAGYEEPS